MKQRCLNMFYNNVKLYQSQRTLHVKYDTIARCSTHTYMFNPVKQFLLQNLTTKFAL